MANRLSFAELLRDRHYPVVSSSLDTSRTNETAAMVFELFRDKVITSFQANEILLAMGFTTVRDSFTGELVTYR